jgi:hypothetical protein
MMLQAMAPPLQCSIAFKKPTSAPEETRMVPAWLQTASSVATLILLVVLIFLGIAVMAFMMVARRELRRASVELAKALGTVAPMLKDAIALVAEMKGIAASVRSDAVVVHQFVTDADSRAREIGQRAEVRLAELDSAFGVLRDGLEDAVVSVAAVAHGVRAGTAALGIGEEEDTDELEAPEETMVENGAVASDDEDDDLLEVSARGHNGDDRARSPGRRAQPRIRGQRREE